VDASSGAGGLALRWDDRSYLTLQARGHAGGTTVTAEAVLSGLRRSWSAELPIGEVELAIETVPPARDSPVGADTIRLVAASGPAATVLAELDGRYWCAETAMYFTGRVTGPVASDGVVTFRHLAYRGADGLL
jgi:hypothetical protein